MNEQLEHPITDVEEKEVTGQKWLLAIVVFLFALCVLAGSVHLFYSKAYLNLFQLCGCLLIGCLYVFLVQRKLTLKDDRSAYAIFLCIGFPITLYGIYLFAHRPDLLQVIYFAACFSLPLVIMQTWDAFFAIQSGTKLIWHYSKDIPPEPMFVYLENKPIRFKVLTENQNPIRIDSVVPYQLQIGMMFFYMLKEKDAAQKPNKYFVDEQGHSYGWIFYTPKYGLWKDYLNPYENLFEHKIRSNTLIVAKQIKSN